MHLNVIGLNHQTAPLAIREKVAINADSLRHALLQLKKVNRHGILLSTCNRTEIYALDTADGHALDNSRRFFADRANITADDLSSHVYVHCHADAARHLFRVAGGLESMVIGEYEVLGQVRRALQAAETSGMVNLPLRHVFQSALRIGRRVRLDTGISKNPMSVSSVAVDLAETLLGDLSRRQMLIIGVGEAGRLVSEIARKRGVSQILIASRRQESAESLASALQGKAIALDQINRELQGIDIIVTCSAAPHRILNLARAQEAVSKRLGKPLVIIDIAVPRNVDPEVGKLKGIFLYDLDKLNKLISRNREQREAEIAQAQTIIQPEVEKFLAWWHDFEIKPLISSLMGRAEEIRSSQLNRTLAGFNDLPEEQREHLEYMTRAIVNRVLGDPIRYLKSNGTSQHQETFREIFRLNVPECPED